MGRPWPPAPAGAAPLWPCPDRCGETLSCACGGPGSAPLHSGCPWGPAHRPPTPTRPPPQAAAGGRRRRRLRVAAQALQAADYSFYSRLREGELTEEYLWEARLLPLLGYLPAKEATAVRLLLLGVGRGAGGWGSRARRQLVCRAAMCAGVPHARRAAAAAAVV